MKSVLHVAIIAPGGYSNIGIMNGFLSNEFKEYHLFDYQLKTFEFGKEAMCIMLIQEAEKIKPDLIFMQIQGSDILDPVTLKRLSSIAFTVNYTFDIRSKEQTEWLYDLAPVLGLICFSNQRDVDECKRRGYNNVMVLQSSVDMDVYKPPEKVKCHCPCHTNPSVMHVVACCHKGYIDKERSGIVFIGNNFDNTNIQFPLSKERVNMVEYLEYDFTDQFKVYGNNWGISKMTNPKEEIEIYQSALIAVNHNNFDEELYTSDRIWRIMSTGAFCLTKYFKGVEKLFTRGEHLDWWADYTELGKMVKHYLRAHTTSRIASKGMYHVRGNHNWQCRIAEMMIAIGPIKKSTDKDACTKFGAHVIDGTIPTAMDQQFDGRTCDCGKTLWEWTECGCSSKEYQLRAKENI